MTLIRVGDSSAVIPPGGTVPHRNLRQGDELFLPVGDPGGGPGIGG